MDSNDLERDAIILDSSDSEPDCEVESGSSSRNVDTTGKNSESTSNKNNLGSQSIVPPGEQDNVVILGHDAEEEQPETEVSSRPNGDTTQENHSDRSETEGDGTDCTVECPNCSFSSTDISTVRSGEGCPKCRTAFLS